MSSFGEGSDPLATGLAAAAATWGPFDLALDRFAERATALVGRRLARRGVERTPETLREALGRTACADLALAVACEDGVPGAWEALVAGLRPRLEGLARKRGLADADAEALAADVLSEMSMPATGTRTLLGTFDGTGSLFAWSAVILVRRLSRLHGRGRARALVSITDPVSGGDAAGTARPDDDPARALGDAETARRFERALRAAWDRLSGRERLALAYRYVDGRPQTEIAAVLGVSQPRTSRIVAGAVEKLRAAADTSASGETGGGGLWAALADAVRRTLASTSAAAPLPGGSHERSRKVP